MIHENLILNKKDLEINLDKFESGEKNVLLVTGFSGSGKSTLASQLASKYKCTNYELDCLDFYLGGFLSEKDMIGNEDALYEFVKRKKLKFGDKSKSSTKLYKEYIKFIINWCKRQKDKKFIIEGLQIYETFEEGDTHITSCPMIIKGTSGFVSAIRGAKRNSKDSGQNFFKEFKPLVQWVLKDNKSLNKLIKSINESYIEESSANKSLYHLSKSNLDGKILQPRIPSNFLVKNGYEDDKTERVCFAKSIDGSLRGMSQNLKGMKLYVHIPDGEYDTYNPTTKQVPDCKITSEVWIKEPVKLKCIGQIEVIKDKGEDGIPYKYGNNTAELYDWDWKWIDKINY